MEAFTLIYPFLILELPCLIGCCRFAFSRAPDVLQGTASSFQLNLYSFSLFPITSPPLTTLNLLCIEFNSRFVKNNLRLNCKLCLMISTSSKLKWNSMTYHSIILWVFFRGYDWMTKISSVCNRPKKSDDGWNSSGEMEWQVPSYLPVNAYHIQYLTIEEYCNSKMKRRKERRVVVVAGMLQQTLSNRLFLKGSWLVTLLMTTSKETRSLVNNKRLCSRIPNSWRYAKFRLRLFVIVQWLI